MHANKERKLDFEYRKELITLLDSQVKYGGRRMSLSDASELFVLDVFRAMSPKDGCPDNIKEIELV